jgi:hypothetical protein
MEQNQFDPLEMRRNEVAQYEANIAMYTAISASLPSEWPERLLKYKSSTNRHEDVSKIEDLNDVELVSDLWAREQAESSIRSEIVEKRKAEAILAYMESQV